jgi:hypothetical protein
MMLRIRHIGKEILSKFLNVLLEKDGEDNVNRSYAEWELTA